MKTMKQIKFFAFALTLLMGLTFTSCLDGDSNPIQQLQLVARYGGGYYGSYFTTPDGLKLIPTDISKLPTASGLYNIYFEYNTEESAGQKEINITLLANPVQIPPKYATPSTSSTIETPNAAMAMLKYSAGYQVIAPLLYDKSTMLFPMLFWSISTQNEEEWKKELAKHEFEVVYSFDKAKEPNTLILTLKHKVTDTEVEEDKKPVRKTLQVAQYALNMASAISEAKREFGTLSKIKVVAQCNANNSDDLSKATESYFEIDCSKINFD